MFNNNEIKQNIEKVLSLCKEEDIYSNIMTNFFKKGILKPSIYLNSLMVLPKLNESQLEYNFKKNINKILFSIRNELKPNNHIYNVLSCIYGAFLSDALGAFCEFSKLGHNNYQKIFNNIPVFGGVKGQVTDDSEMAMSFAYGVMDNPLKNDLDINYLYFYYGAWYKSKPLDIGTTTENAFKKFDFLNFHPKKKNFNNIENEIFTKNYNSLSNGFLMRKCTFIVWFFFRFFNSINMAFNDFNSNESLLNLYFVLRDFSRIDNECTHPNMQTDAASAFYCLMALGAIYGLKANNILFKILSLCEDNLFLSKGDDYDKCISQLIMNTINLINKDNFQLEYYFGRPESKDCINTKAIGWYVHSFKLTLYYLKNFELYKTKNPNNTYREIINEICNLGGDTDTNACVVGGVIGPLIGMFNFGDDFNKVLEVIPPNRAVYSIPLMVLYVIYLNKSNKNDELIKNDQYFLKTILTLLYDEIELDYY